MPLCAWTAGSPWLLVSDDARIFCARKKNVFFNYPSGSNDFLVFLIYPPIYMRVHQPNHFEFEYVGRLKPD
jgi:hypothetical protein